MSETNVRFYEYWEWRRIWAVTHPATRRRIESAVADGEALDDPEEAALAVGLVEQRRGDWLRFGVFAGLILIVIIGILFMEDVGSELGNLGVLVSGVIVAAVNTYRLQRKLGPAEQANRDVVNAAVRGSLPPPARTGSMRDALKVWRRQVDPWRRRRTRR